MTIRFADHDPKIYDASDPGFKINPCRFFDTDEDALADMKRLAETGR